MWDRWPRCCGGGGFAPTTPAPTRASLPRSARLPWPRAWRSWRGGPPLVSWEADVTVVVWLTEQSWQACVDATPADADVLLLYVVGEDVPGVAHGAFTGLLGRGRPGGAPGASPGLPGRGRPDRDPATRIARLATDAAGQLLHDAAARFDRP